MEPPQPLPQILSPCSSGRRRSCDTNSPEFEFWMVRNPSFPQPNLLSADELFSDGLLLPLHLLQLSSESTGPDPQPSSTVESATSNPKRRRNIFKKKMVSSSISSRADDQSTREKREKKNGGGASFGAELNINIWPFSRSRSAGNGGSRPKAAWVTRKVSSAPCSRSNSTGESKSRKSAQAHSHSPNRAGVHLGRNSPVWQVRRRSSEPFVNNNNAAQKGAKTEANQGHRKIPAAKSRVLSLNVPMCIGYRNHLSCKHDESSTASVASAGSRSEGVSGEVGRRSNLFNIRSLFTRKAINS